MGGWAERVPCPCRLLFTLALTWWCLLTPSLFYFFPSEVCQQEAVAKQCHSVHLPFSLPLAALGGSWRTGLSTPCCALLLGQGSGLVASLYFLIPGRCQRTRRHGWTGGTDPSALCSGISGWLRWPRMASRWGSKVLSWGSQSSFFGLTGSLSPSQGHGHELWARQGSAPGIGAGQKAARSSASP